MGVRMKPSREVNAGKTLYFSKETIQRVAQNRLSYSHFAKIFIRQAWSENRLRFVRKVNFRKRDNDRAVQAYCEMTLRDFEGINARQQWANWRTIPKNLSGILPNKAMMAIDLCCGTGHSTEVLACYLPVESSILGIEYNPSFVKRARAQKYYHMNGQECAAEFSAQSVLDQFKDGIGNTVPDGSVDLVNSCGAVGVHFDSAATSILAQEVARVLCRGGLALIDSGGAGTPKEDLIRIFKANGFKVRNFAKSCALDLYTQVCFVKE